MKNRALMLGCVGLAMVFVSLTTRAQTAETDDKDDPDALQVYPYLGLAIDNFAASDVSDYLNFEESGKSKTRETFGIAFQYNLYATPEKASTRQVQRFNSVTVYGQTTHGVRSTDVDCEADPQNPLCVPFGPEIADAQNDPTQRALFILRNASSLEAVLGLRYEFLSLQHRKASLYTTIQAGFVAVEDDDDDVADINHIAFGARITQGRYRDSFVEIAKGENDLFADNPNDRSKVNARLVTRPGLLGEKSILFAHIVADVDGDEGADSVQTFLGVAFCFGGNTTACKQASSLAAP